MEFDAVIVGSGQAGTPLAFYLAGKKQKVALIEKATVGGTCVNTGCTPTKAYVASAKSIWNARQAESMGILVPEGVKADLQRIRERKDRIVGDSVNNIMKNLKKNEYIDFFHGDARFISDKILKVNDREISAENIFLNTGARASIPREFNEINFLTNESILELNKVPEHLIIVGGSYIGLEFGQMFSRFGSKVTIVEKSAQLIGKEDKKISEAILKYFENDGINVFLSSEIKDVQQDEKGIITIRIASKNWDKNITGSHLLIAAGRIPNTDKLGLENTRISINDKGYIQTDDFLESNVEGIYALGDCNGKGAFTHTSYNDYEIVTDRLYGDSERKVSDRILTYCLYIDPPLGRAGISLEEAKQKGYDILYGHIPMSEVSRAVEKGETRGFMEMIIDTESSRIIGASVLGSGGDEIIGGILNAMYGKVDYRKIKNAVIPHPTVSELIPTMLESLEKPDK